MTDFSFLRLKPTLNEAMNVGNSPMASIVYYDAIRLSPNEGYRQITNVDGGIALQSDFTAELVDCEGGFLEDVTEHIYTSEVVDSNGNAQLIIEILNLPTDWYNRPVLLKLYDDFVEYFSNPFNVTEEFKELTTYFEYECSSDFMGIPYTTANVSQSIRLACYFEVPNNESEISDYYQISRQATISARVNYKSFESYKFDYTDRFVYDRLNVLLQNEIIYIDTVRVTNKVSFESSERIDKTNFFETTFSVSKNYSDTRVFEFEIFEGLLVVDLAPIGYYTLAGLPDDGKIKFNIPITFDNLTISVYTSFGDLVESFTDLDFVITGGNQINIIEMTGSIISNGSYYVNVSTGIMGLGVMFEGVNDSTTWTFIVGDADYDSDDYSDDYFIN